MKQFPNWIFILRQHAELSPVSDWPDWYADWWDCLVLDRERSKDIIPASERWNAWIMDDRPRPLNVTIATVDGLMSGQPREVLLQRQRQHVIGLATNLLELRLETEMDEVSIETFLLADPDQEPVCFAVEVDWIIECFAQLPDFSGQLARMQAEEFPAAMRYRREFERAQQEAIEEYRKTAHELIPAPGHFFPLEVGSGPSNVAGAIRLNESIGNRFLANVFLSDSTFSVTTDTELHRVSVWHERGKLRQAHRVLGVIRRIL
jgi:hypothetical protein